MVCATAGSDFQSFGGDCFASGWCWVSDDAYGPHRVLKASGRHMNVALPRIKALAFILCDIAAGAVRDMQHDSNRHLGSCFRDIAAGAVRDMQHDSDSAAGTCEGGGAQEPKSMI
jgi:hypothetical protein